MTIILMMILSYYVPDGYSTFI